MAAEALFSSLHTIPKLAAEAAPLNLALVFVHLTGDLAVECETVSFRKNFRESSQAYPRIYSKHIYNIDEWNCSLSNTYKCLLYWNT